MRGDPSSQRLRSSGGPSGGDRLFLTAEEVGQLLGLKKSRVYELAAGGMLPIIRLGRRILFPRRGLEALIDEAIAQARPAPAVDSSHAGWEHGGIGSHL